MTAAVAASPDALTTLRDYRALAPWGLRDLAALAGALLEASNVVPLNAAARARPTERTIRYYVTRGLVAPPDGRGTAAVYGYRHLLQVLAIKLRQMEGATLEALTAEFTGLTGDVIERRVATVLGVGLPPADRLPLLRPNGSSRGKVARAMHQWIVPPVEAGPRGGTLRRIIVGPGMELLVDEQHPALRLAAGEPAVAEAVRGAIGRLLDGA
ncbi:MAG TPA: MerR family transcriptional regulator [Gemmatimonadales bacterium]|nr:MerR family transcriptional regulator [Gemmatimonadales bacterium]